MESGASPEWKKAFADRREAFIGKLREAVAGTDVVARRYDAEQGYQDFACWVEGRLVEFGEGTLEDAEAFLRHLIDCGHKVAFAVCREGKKAQACVSYDADEDRWSPEWPPDFRVEITETSKPMTEVW